MRFLWVAGLVFGLAACSNQVENNQPTAPAKADLPEIETVLDAVRRTEEQKIREPAPTYNLPALADCVRETGGVIIASHRGGPAPGYPENALATLRYGLSRGIWLHEIDVAETEDGVLTLMHDRRINRTTTGDGFMADVTWDELRRENLVDNNGKRTSFKAPKFTDVLLWAKQSGAILELDKKETTSFRNIASAVEAAGAQNNVIFISYNDEQAAQIASIDKTYMMTASARGSRDLDKLKGLGVDPTRVIAWTGTREPDAAAWGRNAREGVESAFGTLGRKGERLDDTYWADGDGAEYQKLVDDGLVLIASDEAYKVADYLTADDNVLETCGK